MGLKERIEAALRQSQQSACDSERALREQQEQAKLAEARRLQSLLTEFNPILQDRLHITEQLRTVEREARKIFGKPPKGYIYSTGFTLGSYESHTLLIASAVAGSHSWSKSDINGVYATGISPDWTLPLYVDVESRDLIIGTTDPYHYHVAHYGVGKPLGIWTAQIVENELLQYFQRTALPHAKK